MRKRNWIIIIAALLLMIIGINASSIYATFTYVSQATELKTSEYVISGNALEIDLNKIEDLSEIGGAVTIVDDALPSYILIAMVGQKDYRVVSSECPHRGHAMGYIHEDAIFKCSSLGGETFDIDGNYVSGTVEENLTTYGYTIDDGVMRIELSAS